MSSGTLARGRTRPIAYYARPSRIFAGIPQALGRSCPCNVLLPHVGAGPVNQATPPRSAARWPAPPRPPTPSPTPAPPPRQTPSPPSLSGADAAIGVPASDAVRISSSSGTSPRNSVPSRCASTRAPPWPKMCERVAAVRAAEETHVLHQPQHRHAGPLEHPHAAARVDQRDVLRRGDDHRAGQRHPLRHGQLRIAGAGRHVHHQDVERRPTPPGPSSAPARPSPSGRARSSASPRRPGSRSTCRTGPRPAAGSSSPRAPPACATAPACAAGSARRYRRPAARSGAPRAPATPPD